MGMSCYQCQETAGNKGCTVRGVCGKTEDVAKRMDLLLYVLKGISTIVVNDKLDVKKLDALNGEVLTSLFMTITNANFDADAIERQIIKMLALRSGSVPRWAVPVLGGSLFTVLVAVWVTSAGWYWSQ